MHFKIPDKDNELDGKGGEGRRNIVTENKRIGGCWLPRAEAQNKEDSLLYSVAGAMSFRVGMKIGNIKFEGLQV